MKCLVGSCLVESDAFNGTTTSDCNAIQNTAHLDITYPAGPTCERPTELHPCTESYAAKVNASSAGMKLLACKKCWETLAPTPSMPPTPTSAPTFVPPTPIVPTPATTCSNK